MASNNGTVYVDSTLNKDSEKLDKLVKESNHTIYSLASTFPFQLFPDRIIIDENKITIARKELFFKRVFSILYNDILTIKVNRSFLFASIEFDVKRAREKPRPVVYLHPSEASLAKKYIIGLVQAKKAGVDFSNLTTKEIRNKLEEIGAAEEEAENLF